MSVTTPREPDPSRDRAALRGAVLRQAALLVDARDVLLVEAPALDLVRLAEAVVCGEHWDAGVALDLAREPLLLRALTGERVVRCCPRRPRRVCGPFWSTAATLVPRHGDGGSTVVVFAGGRAQPDDELAREAAAMATGLGAERRTGAAGGAPYAVVVVQVDGVAGSPVLLDLLTAGLGIAGARVLRGEGAELRVIAPLTGELGCERVVERVRALVGGAGRPAVGWALARAGEPPARAVEVARAMARHDGRLRREEHGCSLD